MNIIFDWDSIDDLIENQSLIEDNLTNEIMNTYQDFGLTAKKIIVSLHFDLKADTIVGWVINEKNKIGITLSYSLKDSHFAVYTLKDA